MSFSPLRICIVHNTYQKFGGEDAVVKSEADLLERYGHDVVRYTRSNDEVNGMSNIALAKQTVWSRQTKDDLSRLIRSFRPDVIHSHNSFPLISPSLYWTATDLNVPIVQTLHNFRLACLNALLLREGKVCEDCVGTSPWRGVVRRCYRNSLPASTVAAVSMVVHRWMGTYTRKVTAYIALNEFCKAKMVEAGLPSDHIWIKPNFIDAPVRETQERSGLLFVGRLSVEKGAEVLARAIRSVPSMSLKVLGEGPLEDLFQANANVDLTGFVGSEEVQQCMGRAIALIVPSIWYENFPRTIVEAYACGLPVIASRIGALPELVRDGETGLLFEPGNSESLAKTLAWASENRQAMQRMGINARKYYEQYLGPEHCHASLMGIYRSAMESLVTKPLLAMTGR